MRCHASLERVHVVRAVRERDEHRGGDLEHREHALDVLVGATGVGIRAGDQRPGGEPRADAEDQREPGRGRRGDERQPEGFPHHWIGDPRRQIGPRGAEDERGERGESLEAIFASVRPKLGAIPGARVFALNPAPIRGLSRTGGFEFQLQDRASGPLGELADIGVVTGPPMVKDENGVLVAAVGAEERRYTGAGYHLGSPRLPAPRAGCWFSRATPLPFGEQTLRPAGTAPDPAMGAFSIPPAGGACAPDGYLAGPVAGSELSAAEVETVVQQAKYLDHVSDKRRRIGTPLGQGGDEFDSGPLARPLAHTDDPGRFWHCVVDFFVDLPARDDSLSVWQLVPGPLRAVLVLALVAVAYVVVLRGAPRTPGSSRSAAAR